MENILTISDYIIASAAAIAAGLINALAGGGTLITFPILMFIGLPSVTANVTNTVALCPGYLGGTLAQKNDLKDQNKLLFKLLPAGILGGVTGGILLLVTGEKLFTQLVPFLILLASVLLSIQGPIKKMLSAHQQRNTWSSARIGTIFIIYLAAIYGGYFGAGLSVILLAVLGLMINANLTKLNALKQAIAFATNISAALFFVFSGFVHWTVALFMAVGALAGGAIGGRLATKIKPKILRIIVVSIGFLVGIIYLIRNITAS